MKRVTFVDGQETDTPDSGFVACGDGTDCPIEATLDQIAEIWYRVKDAWFISGEYGAADSGSSGPPFVALAVTASTSAPTDRALKTLSTNLFVRGYTTLSELVGVPHNAAYLGTEYNADTSGGTLNYRDISDNERGMWLVGEIGVNRPYWNIDDNGERKNAFSWDQSSDGVELSSDYFQHYVGWNNPGYNYSTAGGSFVGFSGEVAVVRVDPADGFYAATNKFFLNVLVAFQIVGSRKSDFSYPQEITPRYIIRLSSGDISCPLYIDAGYDYVIEASDFVHAAQEWWPYAKGNPANPVWDFETGALL